jgi:phosphomannomutase
MSSKPQLTVSGYRGIWGESLTQDIAQRYVRAFISFVKSDIESNPTILIGRDGRESGIELKKAIIDQLEILGIRYIDGDILPTPTVLFAVRKHNYDGAIIITASHNPIEYNGLKFVTDKALFTDEADVEKIKKYYESDNSLIEDHLPLTTEKNIPSFAEEHALHIINHIDKDKIRERKFKVAVDMINASACVLDPYLFKQLNIEYVAINDIPNGKFTHKPEPLRENLTEIAQLVKDSKADVGFAHDPDADRLVVVDEKGEIISEEHTLALGVEQVLSTNKGQTVVINMSTSQMSADIAKKYNGTCIRTKVGEANVVKGIIENDAIIGGEGGGSSIYPTINTARDSFVSLALVLELLAQRNQTVNESVQELPHYIMRKDKIAVIGTIGEMYQKMKSHFRDAEINELDGLRLDFNDRSWIHLRPSNTEPIVRLYGEAKEEGRLASLFEGTKSLFIP